MSLFKNTFKEYSRIRRCVNEMKSLKREQKLSKNKESRESLVTFTYDEDSEDESIENEESSRKFVMDTLGEIDFADITVGEPNPGFRIHQPLIFSHNYFHKFDQDRGLCLLCLKLFGDHKIMKTNAGDTSIQFWLGAGIFTRVKTGYMLIM